MLYIFLVSSGLMKKFDMNLALKNVMELKVAIEKSLSIPVSDQVLLCSGGEELKPHSRVGNYGAGTDTNPIFLFSKHTSDTENQHTMHSRASSDLNIEYDVQGCVGMAPSREAVTVRCNLAQRLAELAVNERKECDDLVHGQHLQQQGWAAVIANLDDAKEALLKRKTHVDEIFQQYLENRVSYQEALKTFPSDIELLSKVPLLPKLVLGVENLDENKEQSEHTLLSWFCSEPRLVLESLAEKCQRSLDELNQTTLEALNNEVNRVWSFVDNPYIKEVRGIEERLFTLNTLIEDARKHEKDQRDLANWFTHTLNLINKDPSVLPDMCGTFQSQLELMLLNHQCLKDILDKCTKAKAELCDSIHGRLKYICMAESLLYELQVQLVFHEKHVKSVVNQIKSFQQVHVAPQRYLKMLAEVCRRKSFSSSFMKWATELSAQALKVYDKEVSIRNSFKSKESKNIVDDLFPGMEDVPPPFAIECPQPFDHLLPNITPEDLEILKKDFPELAIFCEVPLSDPMPYFSQKSAESDSAFGSNVPSSRAACDMTVSSGGLLHPSKEERLLVCASSVTSQGDGQHNETGSLTSSPFEDCALPTNDDLELDKRTKSPPGKTAPTTVPPGDNPKKLQPPKSVAIVDSDGDEFESLDQFEATSPTKVSKRMRTTSSSDVIIITRSKLDTVTTSERQLEATSPADDRLKVSDSLHTSHDFQSTEYFIDDSMPSSYTESTGLSPVVKENQMVKSHHVVVAELQRQVEEKSGALSTALCSLKTSQSNALRLHDSLSAFQKTMEEARDSLRADVTNLRSYVKEEFWSRMNEVAQVVEKLGVAMGEVQRQIVAEKEQVLFEAKKGATDLENTYQHRLEVETQKLNDAENQIACYEDKLREEALRAGDLIYEKEQMETEVGLKNELIKSMMLEHELELDSLRNQMRQQLQEKDDQLEAMRLERLSFEESLETRLRHECDSLANNLEKEMKEKDNSFGRKLDEQKQCHAQELQRLQEKLDLSEKEHKEHCQSLMSNAENELLKKIGEEQEEKLRQLKEDNEKKVAEIQQEQQKLCDQKLVDLEESLKAQHKSEMDSLRSRYKLAYSTTTIERMSSESSLENICLEKDVIELTDHEKIVGELVEKHELSKTEIITQLTEEQEMRLKKAVDETRLEELVRFEKEVSEAALKLQKEHEEQLERLKSRYTVENQVSFNEAINRVAKEKDVCIEELNCRNAVLAAKFVAIKSLLEKYRSCARESVSSEALLSQSESGASSSFKATSKNEELNAFLNDLKKELELHQLVADYIASPPSSSSKDLLIVDLEKKLKLKEDESEILISKFMKPVGNALTHGSKTCRECADKVSVLTCEDNDLVLICYEEKHENFAIFYFGQYLHFLHTESLQVLDLKIPPGPSGKSWSLGVVMNKEFCISKKASNRYNVSLGTRFYRVKVRPWDRETALMLQRTRRRHQMESTSFVSPSSSGALNINSPTSEDRESQATSHMSASSI